MVRLLALLVLSVPAALAIDFSREILPLLSDKCISCHGPDPSSRMANLRLDTREGALAVIVPGNPASSKLIARVAPAKPALLMPPTRSHKAPLTAAEVELLRRWIADGAVWGQHWAFIKPQRPAVPANANPIDSLLHVKDPNPKAPAHTLRRRLAFDLTGLPPTSDAPYETLLDQLLASPHYGERMAMWWLDGARYADTDGFQADDNRTNWPWRDWVADAFNKNLPFNQFTLHQFAGDLIPNPTPESKLATAFHRNHMTNGEGGRLAEESRIDYVLDRTNTTGTVFLGLTLGCAQCHTHKFDPIAHRDYYSFTAFFNSIDEDGQAGRKANPYLAYESPYAARAIAEAQQLLDQRKPAERQARVAAEAPFATWLQAQTARVKGGYQAWQLVRPHSLTSAEGTQFTVESDAAIQTSGPLPRQDDYRLAVRIALPRVTGFKLEILPNPSLSRQDSGEFLLTDVKFQVRTPGTSQLRDVAVKTAIADYSADKKTNNNYGDIKDTLDDDPRNGWTTLGADKTKPHTAQFELVEPLVLGPQEEVLIELRHRSTAGNQNIGRFRLSATADRGPAVDTLGPAPLEQLAANVPNIRARLFAQFLTDHAPYVAARAALDRAQSQFDEVKASTKVNVMVLAERATPRESHILLRGVWDKKGEVVTPNVLPAIFPMAPDQPRNRLGLANWLIAPENPLPARVIVNQLWQLMFGVGLVRTPEDFGQQGDQPTHPELLDWLAVEFVEKGWDVKHILRLIASSEAYQRDSHATPTQMAADPANVQYARGARFRLPSWMLRDAAISHASLLNPAFGGPPVRPYQPEGVWEELFMGRFRYDPSEGAAQYRRTLYSFWRRTIAPTFLFDSAQRRSCEVRTSRTNTPLQALTLLNDETYLEASQTLASLPPARIFERVLHRRPDAAETAILQRQFDTALRHYRTNPKDAASLLASGKSKTNPTAERAAAMLVASLILNLDEAITHE
ncbi:MAG: PSD1 and planctomycete cytochrome C domain-containing protein [Acidobacteria bacterium]|nr:PSD1 and planctomycete cytochrome C domain-containing protein [Acidobacteriota bacterium]